MKMKRFISAFAALAMSVSCFAGLTITGHAASYQIDEVLYGVTTMDTEDNTKIASVARQESFEGETTLGSEDTETYATGKKIGSTTFHTGSVLKHGRATQHKDFSQAYSTGIIHFELDYTVLGGQKNRIQLKNSDGTQVVGMYSSDSSSAGSAEIEVFTVGTEAIKKWVYGPRNVPYRVSVDLDLDLHKYTYSVTYAGSGSSGTANGTKTEVGEGTLANDINIKSLQIDSTGYDTSFIYVDNIALYHSSSTAQSYAYTINYKKAGEETPVRVVSDTVPEGTIITADTSFTESEQKYFITAETAPTLTVTSAPENNVLNVEVREANTYNIGVAASTGQTIKTTESVIEGTDYSYAFSKYLTDSNHKVLGTTTETTYGVTLPSVDDTSVNYAETNTRNYTVTIPYTTYNGDAWFYEGEAGAANFTESNLYSGNAYRTKFNAGYIAATAPENGTYRVTIRTGAYGYQVNVFNAADATDETKKILSTSTKDTTISTETDVSLKAGDPIFINAGHSGACLDYLLLEKTGDLPPTAEVKDEALFQPVDPATGEHETVSFDDLIGEDTLATKTIAVTIYDTTDTPPTMSINGGEDFTPQWTAKTDSAAGTRTFYAQFMAAEDDFDKFGTVVVKYGGQTVLSQPLVTNSDPTP